MIQIIPNWHPIFVHFSVALLATAAMLYVSAMVLRAHQWAIRAWSWRDSTCCWEPDCRSQLSPPACTHPELWQLTTRWCRSWLNIVIGHLSLR